MLFWLLHLEGAWAGEKSNHSWSIAIHYFALRRSRSGTWPCVLKAVVHYGIDILPRIALCFGRVTVLDEVPSG